jgi:hypothetical protein
MSIDSATKGALRLTTGKLALTFNTSSGAMSQLVWNGQPLLLSELRPNFWRGVLPHSSTPHCQVAWPRPSRLNACARHHAQALTPYARTLHITLMLPVVDSQHVGGVIAAPVDNDLGWQMPLKLRMWRAASQHKKQALLRFSLLRAPDAGGGGACLFTSWRAASSHLHSGRSRVLDLDGSGKSNLRALAKEGDRCGLGSNQTCVQCLYTISAGTSAPPSADGTAAASALPTMPSIGVECRYLPGGRMRAHMPHLPRFGVGASVQRKLSSISWFGKGPMESYADRQSVRRCTAARSMCGA